MKVLVRLLICLLLLSGTARARQADEVEITIQGRQAWVWASSFLKSEKRPGAYQPANAFDGDPATAWVEGVNEDPKGQYLSIEFDQEITLQGVLLLPGYTKSPQIFAANSIPAEIMITADGFPLNKYKLYYDLEVMTENSGQQRCAPTGARINFSPRVVLFDKPVKVKRVDLTILSSINGRQDPDLCISEWSFIIEGEKATLAGRSLDQIVDLLTRVKSGALAGESQAARVDDLVAMAESAGVVGGSDLMEFRDRFAAVGRQPGSPTAQVFLQACRWSFLEAPVTVYDFADRDYLIGAMTYQAGNDKWFEIFPAIVMEKGRAVRFQGMTRRGGLPGCREVLPVVERQN